MSRRKFQTVLALFAFFSMHLALPGLRPVLAAETHTEFNLKEEQREKGNVFELIFGAAPPMATERGILLIDAFFDRNGNDRRDAGEEELDREIFCLVDGIEYDVPAFIPGLSYRGSYKVICAGDRYEPAIKKEDLFIDRRGQILRVDIPCRKPAPETAVFQR